MTKFHQKISKIVDFIKVFQKIAHFLNREKGLSLDLWQGTKETSNFYETRFV